MQRVVFEQLVGDLWAAIGRALHADAVPFESLSADDHLKAEQAHLAHQQAHAELLTTFESLGTVTSTTRTIERSSPSGRPGLYTETEYASGARTYRPA